MRIRHLAIGAIAVVGLTLSACAGGAGAGAQSGSGAASGAGDSSASASSAASGAEDSSADQSADGADSALSADSATSSAGATGAADAPASAPSPAGGQSGQESAQVASLIELTHIPEGFEEQPAPAGGVGYKNVETRSGFIFLIPAGADVSGHLPPELLFRALAQNITAENVTDGEKVTVDGTEFETAYADIVLEGQPAKAAIARGDRNGVKLLMFVVNQDEGPSDVDPALVKSILEGIKWKK